MNSSMMRVSGRMPAAPQAHTRPVFVALRPRPQTASSRPCQVASSSWGVETLKPWQLQRLEEAWLTGRRRVKIKQLAGDTQLSREEVIEWFQWWGALPEETRASMREARVAAQTAHQERQAVLDAQRQAAVQEEEQEKLHYREIQELKRKKRQFSMSKAQIATLQMIYDRGNTFPNSSLVSEMCAMHNLSKAQVVNWFAARRRNEGWSDQSKSLSSELMPKRTPKSER